MSNKTRTGWVYVLVNESIADQVKVGFTSGHPEDRAKELHSSGVPTPYKVATAFLFSDKAYAIEQKTHRLLKGCRVSPDREFFRCDAKFAAGALLLAASQLNEHPTIVAPILLSPEEIAAQKLHEQEKQRLKEEELKTLKRRDELAEEERRRAAARKQRHEDQEQEAMRKRIEEEEKLKKKQRAANTINIVKIILIFLAGTILLALLKR